MFGVWQHVYRICYILCHHWHAIVYQQFIDFSLSDALFEEHGGGHFAGIVEEVGGSLGVDFDFEEEVVDVLAVAVLVGDELVEKLRGETRVNVLVFEYWKKPSVPWERGNNIIFKHLFGVLHRHAA